MNLTSLNLTSLDSLGSWESIYVYFKTIKLEKLEIYNFRQPQSDLPTLLILAYFVRFLHLLYACTLNNDYCMT